MNAVVIYSRSKAESGMLHDAFRAIAGFRERDAWTVRRAATREELLQAVTDGAIAQICFADITGISGLPIAEFVRRLFESAQLVLVVDSATPPTSYIRPGILPAGLLFKPLSLEAVRPLMQELLRIVRTRRQTEVFQDAAISVASHGSTYRIPLREVLYFEARNKKLYLYTQNAEIEFYDTLERLQTRLPKEFLRCHKSFVVNTAAIEEIALAQNRITLCGGRIELPISRSYKAAVKEAKL